MENNRGKNRISNRKLFRWAKIIETEALVHGQLQMAGVNQSSVLERFEKNQKALKSQGRFMKVMYGLIFAILPLIPLITFLKIRNSVDTGSVPTISIIFVAGLLLVLFFLIQTVYLLLLGMGSAGSFMTGELFEWLESLPISRRDLQRLSFLTLFRIFDVPLIVMATAFPIIMVILTGSLLNFIVCFATSILLFLFAFSTTLLVAEKFIRILTTSDTSRRATIIRLISMSGYAIIVIFTSIFLNTILSSIDSILAHFSSTEVPLLINIFLSLIPFPFAPAYLVTLVSLPPGGVPFELLVSSLIGFVFFTVLSYRLVRRTIATLQNAVSLERKVSLASELAIPNKTEIADNRIYPTSPIKAYIKKDLKSATRDIQSFMTFLMPMILPLVLMVSLGFGLVGGSEHDVILLYGFLAYANSFTNVTIVVGILRIETSGAAVLAGLPLVPRDQAKAKLVLIFIIQLISNAIPVLFFINLPLFPELGGILLANLPFSLFLAFLVFQLKVVLFGKMTNKYVLEDVQIERKSFKWVQLMVVNLGLLMGMVITAYIFQLTVGLGAFMIILAGIGFLGLFCLYLNFNRLFPRINKPRTKI